MNKNSQTAVRMCPCCDIGRECDKMVEMESTSFLCVLVMTTCRPTVEFAGPFNNDQVTDISHYA